MDTFLPSQQTGSVSARRCLEEITAELDARVSDQQVVPPSAMGVRRFSGRDRTTGLHCFGSMRQYDQPLNVAQLDYQRAIVARLARHETESLGCLLHARVEADGHCIVSSLPGPDSLQHLLRKHRKFEFDIVEALLSQLADALDEAVTCRWPRVMVDTHALFFAMPPVGVEQAPRLKLVVPPLPGSEIGSGTVCIPANSAEYVPELAHLTCELLGMPARRQRFRPLPQLSKETNELLRNVMEGEAHTAFESARQFVSFMAAGVSASPMSVQTFFSTSLAGNRSTTGGSTPPTDPVAHAPTPAPAPAPSTAPAAPAPAPMVSAPTPRSDEPSEEAPTVAVPAIVSQPQRAQVRIARPSRPEKALCSHLRLTSITAQNLPHIGIYTSEEVRIGRGANTHFVSQFFPRSPRNDERTRLLSREHVSIRRQGAGLFMGDLPDANQSFVNGRPIDSKTGIGRFCRVAIAGEYDLELRKLDSWWENADVWVGDEEKPCAVHGALSLTPASGQSSLEFRGLWLFTDAAFGVQSGGALNLNPLTVQASLGWFLVAHGGIWVAATEDDDTIAIDGKSLKARSPSPLHHDAVLKIGLQEWRVQSIAAA